MRWKSSPRVLASACASVVLPTPGKILDQQMPACEQAGKRQADLVFLAEDDAADLNDNGIERIGHAFGMDSWMQFR